MRRPYILLLQISLLAAITSTLLAADVSTCRKLLSVERDVENDHGDSARAAERAYVGCRGPALPVDIRIAAYTRYGDAKTSGGELEAAVDVYRDALSLLDTMNGPDLEMTLNVLDRLSELESEGRHPADAVSHAQRAAELRASHYGAASPEAAIGLARLGIAYVMQRDFRRAEGYLKDSMSIARTSCGPTCSALSEAYAAMSTWHIEQGHVAEAGQYADMSVAATPAQIVRHAKQ